MNHFGGLTVDWGREGSFLEVEVPMLVLASSSPRRRRLLEERGVPFEVIESSIDEHLLDRGDAAPRQWVMALAYLKARSVADALNRRAPELECVVLGADTMCVDGGELLGKPEDAHDAREMLMRFMDAEHEVVTGVAIVDVKSGQREVFADPVRVRWGSVDLELIDRYIASGQWEGKAGAYNLSERLAEGWPIEVEGDPASVMGLPVERVMNSLELFEPEESSGRVSDA